MEPFDLDILTLGGWSDALWSAKRFAPQAYKYATPRSPEQIKEDVLHSRRVKHIIETTAAERQESLDTVTNEAAAILEEMGHTFNMKTLRLMAFMLRKILKTLYRNVMVNSRGLERLREATTRNPVVLIPSHRSYMDFLLVSFVCFATDIQLPFIAAAQDFMNMRVIRRLFRQSGAFFMRRSFVSDKLYFVIFTEYIQNQLQHGEKPLEFFLEGTRSRTGKFLHPKLGVLSMVADLYANAGVPDIQVCPVSVSYERVLEEPLHAYELLGIPKPKESLRGLIKSRSVLSEDYGTINVYFGELIPLSRFIHGKLDRLNFACAPRHIFNYLTEEEKKIVKDLGYRLTFELQRGMVIPPNALVASIVLQHLQGLHIDDLMQRFTWLKGTLKKWDIPLLSSDVADDKLLVTQSLDSMQSALEVTSQNLVQIRRPDSPQGTAKMGASRTRPRDHPSTSVREVLDEAAIHLHLAYRRNSLLFYFFGSGIFALAGHRQGQQGTDRMLLFDDFRFLFSLLVYEVPAVTESVEEVFQQTLDLLSRHDVITVESGMVTTLQESHCEFACHLWRPLLTAYWITCQCLLKSPDKRRTMAQLVTATQQTGAEFILAGAVKSFEVLSLELLKNAVHSLADLQVVTKSKAGAGAHASYFSPDKDKLQRVSQRIGEFLDVPTDVAYVSSTLSKL